MESNGTR